MMSHHQANTNPTRPYFDALVGALRRLGLISAAKARELDTRIQAVQQENPDIDPLEVVRAHGVPADAIAEACAALSVKDVTADVRSTFARATKAADAQTTQAEALRALAVHLATSFS